MMSKNKINDRKANYTERNENHNEEYFASERGNEPQHYKTLKSHSDTISQLVFNPNNKELISASYDYSILIWNINANLNSSAKLLPKKLSGHKSLINDVAISQTGLIIASASSDCTVRLWCNSNDDSSQISSQVYKHNFLPVKSVDISCDSKLLVTGSDDKTVKIIKISDKKLLATLPAHSNWVKCVRFSKDSRLIVSASDDKTVKLWDVNSKALNSTLPNVHNGVVNVVRFHPDNYSLATGCFDKKIRIFDIRSKKLVQVYEEHTKPVTCLDFHPSGNYMASTSFDETVKIYDLRYGSVLYTLTGHEAATSSVAFSKFGEILATGGADSIVNLWTTNLDEEDEEKYVKYACNEFPVEIDVNSIPQNEGTFGHRTEKSSPKMFNVDTADLNYRNKNRPCDINFEANSLQDRQNSTSNSFSYENISEELSKVFEKMVFQLELITTTFTNFESRISKIEDCLDEISSREKMHDILDEENLKHELVNKLTLNNFSK